MAKKNKKRDKKPSILSRRDILQILGMTGGAAVVTGLITSGPLSPEAVEGIKRQADDNHGHGGGDGEYEWKMLIDLEHCIGCQYCVWACGFSGTNRRRHRFLHDPALYALPGCSLCEGLPGWGHLDPRRWHCCDGLRPLYWLPILSGSLPV